jgi:hypothetical protein
MNLDLPNENTRYSNFSIYNLAELERLNENEKFCKKQFETSNVFLK